MTVESCEIRRPGARSRVGVNISKKWQKVNPAAQLAQRSFTTLARFLLREIHRLAPDVIIYIKSRHRIGRKICDILYLVTVDCN